MSHVSVASNDLVAQARALGQSEEAAATDRKRKADSATSEKLRRFAMWYVMTLSTAALVATAFVFDLSGVNLGQTNGHARHWGLKRRQRDSTLVLHRPVEAAAMSRH